MQSLHGQGIWIWQLPQCAGGNPEQLIAQCIRQHFNHVLIKCVDGAKPFTRNAGIDRAIVKRLRELNIMVAGWGYHYGRDPEAEALAAVESCQRLGHSIYVCNSEVEFENPDGPDRARRFIETFRKQADTSITLGLCTFALPSLHPKFPYAAFMDGDGVCDFIMPQIYPVPSRRHPFLSQLGPYAARAMEELSAFNKPVIPVLRAYAGDGVYDWSAMTDDAAAFLASPLAASLLAFNWWNWQSAETHRPLWELLRVND